MVIEEIIKNLKTLITSFDIDELDNQIELLEENEVQNRHKDLVMDTLFTILENNSDEDFGMPGLIVHFLETFSKKGYEDKLLESLQRKPTSHTIWMLNRIINSLEGIEFEEYLLKMKNLLDKENIDNELKDEIKDFISNHNTPD